jgi:menaquinone-dependent protoporphyrinogen oxidase
MLTVQIVFASRHGGTAGIATHIAEVLRTTGFEVAVADAANGPDSTGFDGYVVGSGVYMGSWLKDGTEFLERNQSTLATRPVWLFSSGPLPGSSKYVEAEDPVTVALGPLEGPGSGGHKRIAALEAAIHPRQHRVFLGALDPNDQPKSVPERLVRLMPGSKRILPAGDFRDWDAIEAWAREIAAAMGEKVPVG